MSRITRSRGDLRLNKQGQTTPQGLVSNTYYKVCTENSLMRCCGNGSTLYELNAFSNGLRLHFIVRILPA